MFELVKSLGFALLMVPVVMTGLAALIWGLGEIFNLISKASAAKSSSDYTVFRITCVRG